MGWRRELWKPHNHLHALGFFLAYPVRHWPPVGPLRQPQSVSPLSPLGPFRTPSEATEGIPR